MSLKTTFSGIKLELINGKGIVPSPLNLPSLPACLVILVIFKLNFPIFKTVSGDKVKLVFTVFDVGAGALQPQLNETGRFPDST